MVQPDPQRSRAVLVGVSEYAQLEQLPAVGRSLRDLAACLRDRDLWGLPAENCTVVAEPTSQQDVGHALYAAAQAEGPLDTLLVYYSGHGLLDPQTSELLLTLPGSVAGQSLTAIQYELVRRAVLDSRAERRVVILDCCYSGRALGMMGGRSMREVADRASIEGTVLLASAPENSAALAPPGETYTAFTGALIDLLRNGDANGQPLLDLNTIYWHLYDHLRERGLPPPQIRSRNTAGSLPLIRNRAWRPPDPRGHGAGKLLAGRYRLDHLLGAGGMGEVWRCTDQMLGRVVVVKVMSPDLSADSASASLFRREARILASLNHTGVVAVHDFSNDGTTALLVMENVEGEPLSRILLRDGRLASARTMDLVAQAADALNAAHSAGVVHRDIRPDNLLVRADGTLVVIGFGIARSRAATGLATAGTGPGTDTWVSPEHAAGEATTSASDIYALGVIAYACLTGRRPFQGENPQASPLEDLHEQAPTSWVSIQPAALDLLARCLAKNPADRPSAAELATKARAAVAAQPPSTPSSRTPAAAAPPVPLKQPGLVRLAHRLTPRTRQRAVVTAVAAAAAVVIMLIAATRPLWLGGDPDRAHNPAVPGQTITPASQDPAVEAGADLTWEACDEQPNRCNSGETQDGGEIVWTIDQAPDGYFPFSPEGGSVYTLQAIQGILPHTGQFQPDGSYQHNMDLLAAKPQITNRDPLQTTWRIRDEAVWNDGTPITADDFIVTWKMSTPDEDGHCTGCRPRAFDERTANIESADGGKTFIITYKDGVTDPEWFAAGSAHGIVGGVVPSHVATRNGWSINNPADLGEYFTFLDTTPPGFSGGPYIIEEFDLENQVVKVPNENWYGEEQPPLDRIVIRFLADESGWVPALQNGEIHGASPAGWAPDVILQVQDMNNIRVRLSSGPSWEHIDINMDNRWLGADTQLRRAIFTVVDQEDWATRVYGDLFPEIQTLGNHVHGPGSDYYVDHLAGTGQGTGDVEQARAMLEAAGYDGGDWNAGSLTKDGEQVGPFRIRATTAPARVTGQQLLQSYLADIGIQAYIEPTGDLGNTLVRQDYDIIQFGWSGSPLFTGTGSQFWESGSGSNFGRYSNPDVDALAQQERLAASLDESAALQDQMMDIVVSDAYVLPLFTPPVYIFVADDYVNIRDNTNSSLRALYDTTQWGVAVQ